MWLWGVGRWFSPVKWAQERSQVSRVHLDGARAKLLCADLHWTGSGKARSLDQTRKAQSSAWMQRGGNWGTGKGPGWSVQCTDWQSPGAYLVDQVLPFKVQEPALGPTAHSQMCHNYSFYSVLVLELLFRIKLVCFPLPGEWAAALKGEWAFLGFKRKERKKKKLKIFWWSSRDVIRSWRLPELSFLDDSVTCNCNCESSKYLKLLNKKQHQVTSLMHNTPFFSMFGHFKTKKKTTTNLWGWSDDLDIFSISQCHGSKRSKTEWKENTCGWWL